MKLGHLETRRAVLHTLAPVFTGSGGELTKKEYVYFPNGRRVFVPELGRMYGFLEKKGLTAQYEEFLSDAAQDLLSFLRENKITDEEIKTFAAYEIDAGNAVIDNHPLKGILLFIKNPRNCPYIPGSTLKGALRTALLSYYLENSPDREMQADKVLKAAGQQDMKRGNFLNRETKSLEAHVFNKLGLYKEKQEDAVNDFMKGISVSGSRPLEVDSLVLCTKKDFAPDGREKLVPIYRECLRPGTELIFDITIDHNVAKAAGFGWEDFGKALEAFNKMYERVFFSQFRLPPQSEVTPCKEGQPLYVGGGVGFISKTAVYPLMGRQRGLKYTSKLLDDNFGREHHHKNDPALGVSPHMCKLTQYNGRLYPMGRCELVIKD